MPTLLPVLPVANKARKGDIVVIEIEHSSTAANFKTTYYTRWNLGTVYKASRDGRVERVVMAGSSHSVEVARLGRVHTISARQGEAKRLLETIGRGGREFETSDDIKAAILAA